MKVYFSTSSHDIHKARHLMERIRSEGHEITHDWTEGLENEPSMNHDELVCRAVADIEGVHEADVVVVYMQPRMVTRMTGVAIEMGAAFALGKDVIVVEGEAEFTHFFQNHPCFLRYLTMDRAMWKLDVMVEKYDNSG